MRNIGRIRVDRVIEHEGPDFVASVLLPDATPAALDPHRHWLEPRHLDPATQKFVLATQTYVLRTGRHTILVDTCVGNHKARRFHAPWNMRDDPTWLDGLAAIDVAPESVDFVMCTHLHADHVGWNTRLVDGRWIPTFPNARYVFAREEWTHWQALNQKGAKYSDGCINDSVLPIVEAGRELLVEGDYQFDDEIWFEPTPGHTPGHTSHVLSSGGKSVFVQADVTNVPFLFARNPGWHLMFDQDAQAAEATRRKTYDMLASDRMMVQGFHYPFPAVAFVEKTDAGYREVAVPWSPTI
mgnify:CR=1 FL=1